MKAVEGKTKCQECLDYQRAYRQANIAARMCTSHPKTKAADGMKVCGVCAVRNNARSKKANAALKLAAMNAYGGLRCACTRCPFPEPGVDFLSIDHVDNNGAAHRREIGKTINRWLKKNGYPTGFQVLCHNCNMGKNINGGTCPHLLRR